jgi:uncharacterized protein YbjT (DUF2867 family)
MFRKVQITGQHSAHRFSTNNAKMTLKYLITGATGGLGREVLNYFIANIPRSEFAAASSNTANKATFEDRGIAFRHVNYDDRRSLETGLRGVENLLFVSSSGMSRGEQHARVTEAAKEAGVKHVRHINSLLK